MPIVTTAHKRGHIHIVVGLGHGDEGKGRVVEYVGQFCNFGMRVQGGKNAGHTSYLRFGQLGLKKRSGDGLEVNTHQLPSTIVFKRLRNLIGPDVWLDPQALTAEIDDIRKLGFRVDPKHLGISNLATLTLPHHILEDELKEKGSAKLGSTKSGIAFTARDEALHEDIRANILKKNDSKKALFNAVFEGLKKLGLKTSEAKLQATKYVNSSIKLKPYITEVVNEVHMLLKNGKVGVIETAQGVGLDRRFGKHPHVTSSSTIALGVAKGAGIAHKDLGLIFGVLKTFPSKVGGGEFPEKIKDDKILKLLAGSKGDVDAERGKTTGREREIGWPSIPFLKKYIAMNGIDELVITKWDKLCALNKAKTKYCVVVAYKKINKDGSVTKINTLPDALEDLAGFVPVMRKFEISGVDVRGLRSFDDLPQKDKKILNFISLQLGVPIGMVGVGPRDDQLIVREDLKSKLESGSL